MTYDAWYVYVYSIHTAHCSLNMDRHIVEDANLDIGSVLSSICAYEPDTRIIVLLKSGLICRSYLNVKLNRYVVAYAA